MKRLKALLWTFIMGLILFMFYAMLVTHSSSISPVLSNFQNDRNISSAIQFNSTYQDFLNDSKAISYIKYVPVLQSTSCKMEKFPMTF